MYKRVFFLMIVLNFCQSLFAQTNDSTGIIVHKSTRIDEMLKKQFGGSTSTVKQTMSFKNSNYRIKRQGFRVLVLNTNDRELTYRTKGQLLGRYPNQQVYMVYQAPFFKLKLGDFTSRKEAENYRAELAKTFTKAFIIRETVWVKPEDEAKL